MQRHEVDTNFLEIHIAELLSLSCHNASEIRFNLANGDTVFHTADETKKIY